MTHESNTESTTKPPNPGSNEAVALGCKCPVLDNSYGKGYYMQPGVFVYTMGCPIHPWPSHEEHEEVKQHLLDGVCIKEQGHDDECEYAE